MQNLLPKDLVDVLIKTGERLSIVEKGLTNDAVPIGAEFIWPASPSLLPFNYRACDGSALDRIAFAALFQQIGTNHGVGDGASTFNIPDRDVYLAVPDPICAKIYQSGAQAAPTINTWAQVTFNTTIFNYGGFTIGSNLITVPTTGIYRVTGVIATIANSQTFVGSLTYNYTSAGSNHGWPDGTVVEAFTGAVDSNGVSFPTLVMEGVFEITAGSTIGMDWYQGTATPQAGVAGRNILSVEKILDNTVDSNQVIVIKVL